MFAYLSNDQQATNWILPNTDFPIFAIGHWHFGVVSSKIFIAFIFKLENQEYNILYSVYEKEEISLFQSLPSKTLKQKVRVAPFDERWHRHSKYFFVHDLFFPSRYTISMSHIYYKHSSHLSDTQHEHEIAFPYPSILHYGRIYQRGASDPNVIQ